MNSSFLLFENDDHKFIHLGLERLNVEGIFTNQYLIIHNNEGFLIDPGGSHVFSRVFSNVSKYIDLRNIKGVFFSHQDPDVAAGLSLWDIHLPNAKYYFSRLWDRFMPHYGVYNKSKVSLIEDYGGKYYFEDGVELQFIPAHFLHSSGNFTLYDPTSKVLFSGDIGVGIIQPSFKKIFVDNFNEYKKEMEWFHKRYMSSNKIVNMWISKVENLDVEMMVPQHGLLFRKKEYLEFLDWFRELKCGEDIIGNIYNRG